ncbi:cobalt ABC transport system ATP-binding protein CbiO5 [Clostridium sp. CAG:167]|nr:cobalt ABC transport system ATP-binding protein CbiO5 [Clostridium sp. CAG:167]
MTPIIELKQVSFYYPEGVTPALTQIDLAVPAGGFVLVCGPSGSGKSTLLKHMKSSQIPFGKGTGELLFKGKDLETMELGESARSIGFVGQNPDNQIVTDTVWHELAFGLENLGVPVEEIRKRTAETAQYFGMTEWFRQPVEALSGGQKQMLNLASVMVMQPEVLILDEPTAQMDPIGARRFFHTLKGLQQEIGTTIILSEQRLEEVMPLAQDLVYMENGQIVAQGPVQESLKILADYEKIKNKPLAMETSFPVALRVYIKSREKEEETVPVSVGQGRQWLSGKRVVTSEHKETYEETETVITVQGVDFSYEKGKKVLEHLDWQVKKGSIYGLLGGNGAGKTTLMKLICGILKPRRGKIKTNGTVRYLVQNPLSIFTEITAEDELAVCCGRDPKAVEEMLEKMELTEFREQNPLDLSGGQQQRLALGKVLLTKPEILLLDEPTKGMDGGFKVKFGAMLGELKKQGITTVLVSHDMEFCAEYATYCGLMFDREIISFGPTREFFAENVYYTTAAARMTRGILKDCLVAEDIMAALEKGRA